MKHYRSLKLLGPTPDEISTSSDIAVIPEGGAVSTTIKKEKNIVSKVPPTVTSEDIEEANKYESNYKLGKYISSQRSNLDESLYSEKELKLIENRTSKNVILTDAINGIVASQSLHTMLVDNDIYGDDRESLVLDIDTDFMRNEIIKDGNLSDDEKVRRSRAMNVISNIQKEGFNIVRSTNGRYWIESLEDGKRVYAANAILEIGEILDKYKTAADKEEEQKESKENIKDLPPGIEGIIDDQYKDIYNGFEEHELWALGSLATDVITTGAGLGMKYSAVGALYGAAVSAIGGGISVLMDAYGDYLNPNVSSDETLQNIGIRVGFEAAEVASLAPASLIGKFTKSAKYLKLVRKGLHGAMAYGIITTAQNANWNTLINKDVTEWEVSDWRDASSMMQYLALFSSGLGTKMRIKKELNADAKVTAAIEKKGVSRGIGKIVNKDIGKVKIKSIATRSNEKVFIKAKDNLNKIGNKVNAKNKSASDAIKKKDANSKKILIKNKDKELKILNSKLKPKVLTPKGNPSQSKAAKKINAENKIINTQIKKVNTGYDSKIKKSVDKNKLAADKINKESTKFQKKLSDKLSNIESGLQKSKADAKLIRDKEVSNFKEKRKKKAEDIIKEIKDQSKAAEFKAKEMLGTAAGRTQLRKARTKARKDAGLEEELSDDAKKIKKFITRSDKQLIRVKDNKFRAQKKKKDLSEEIAKNKDKKPTDEQKSSMEELNKKLKDFDTKIAIQTEKAKKLSTKAKSLVEKGANKLDKVGKSIQEGLFALERPLYRLVRRDGVSTKIASRIAVRNDNFVLGRYEKKDIKKVKEELVALGYKEKELSKYSDRNLRIALKKLDAMKNKSKGGRLIRKAQQGDTFSLGSILTYAVSSFFSDTAKDVGNYISSSASSLTEGVADYFLPSFAPVSQASKPTIPSNTSISSGRFGLFNIGNKSNLIPKVTNSIPSENKPLIDNYTPTVEAAQSELDSLMAFPYSYFGNEDVNTRITKLRRYIASEGTYDMKESIAPEKVNLPSDSVTKINDANAGTAEIVPKEEETPPIDKNANNNKKIENEYARLSNSLKYASGPRKTSILNQMGQLSRYIKSSDFLTRNKLFIERPVDRDIIAPTILAPSVTNMPGFESRLNIAKLIPRLDTSDAFAQSQFAKDIFNQGLRNQQQVIAENAGYVDNAKKIRIEAKNRTEAGKVAAINENERRNNAAEATYSNQLAQSKAKKTSLDNQQTGRITNGLTNFAMNAASKNNKLNLTSKYNNILSKKMLWNSQYKPLLDKALTDGDNTKIKGIKNEFMIQYNINPDSLDKQLLDLKTQYSSSNLT